MEKGNLDCVLVTAVDKEGYEWGFTIRGENVDQLFTKINDIKQRFGIDGFTAKTYKPKTFTPKEPQAEKKTQMCPIHNTTMYERKGKFGPFYSHNIDGRWCNGKEKEY